MRKKLLSICMAMMMAAMLVLPSRAVEAEETSSITSDGYLELKSESTSLNVGDIVEVKLYCHTANVRHINADLDYDREVFERFEQGTDIITNDYVMEDGRYQKWAIHYNESSDSYFCLDNNYADDQPQPDGGYLASFNFKVKKAVESTTISMYDMYICWDNYDDINYGEEISVTITNSNDNADSCDFALSADSAEAAAGSDVNIPLSITKNPGINALGITIQYDSDVCSYNSLTVTDAYQDKLALQEVYAVPGGGTVRAAFISADDIPDTGVFANLSFTVKDGVAAGTASDISVTVTQVTNKGETDITGSGATATLTVTEQPQTDNYALGDVNGDGKINLTDAVYILLSYNKEKTLSEAQTLAADVNKDGGADLLDARQILKYFNGELETF